MENKNPNRPRFVKIPGGGESFIHPCGECGARFAPYGIGFSYRKKSIGSWFCKKCYDEKMKEKEIDPARLRMAALCSVCSEAFVKQMRSFNDYLIKTIHSNNN